MEQIAVGNTEVQTREESVFISYSTPARALVLDISKTLSDCGIQYVSDKKHLDTDNTLTTTIKSAIDSNEYYLLACTEECMDSPWMQDEIAYARSSDKRLLYFLENLNIKPPEITLSALTTDNLARLAGYFAYSSVTQTELNIFIGNLLVDKTWTEKEFSCSQQGSTQVWRCKTNDGGSEPATTEAPSLLLSSNEEKPECTHLVEIGISNNHNNTGTLKLGYAVTGNTPTEGYVMHYEPRLRGVLVEPRKQCTLAIGIRNYNGDDGSEIFRAGTPTVDDQMFGRDLYGWHVSTAFWKAALETLSQRLSA
ncbi:MAG: toll/interleukin-1 receptor domain-containing protein [Gammaproteobacteria bacterium]